MKEAIVLPGPLVKIIKSPISEPNDDQVLIKVIVSASNRKDWKAPDLAENIPEDLAASANFSYAVGSNAVKFKVRRIVLFYQLAQANLPLKSGDRVAAFHEMCTPGDSYAEYAIAWSHSTFHLPKHTSFEEAATIPPRSDNGRCISVRTPSLAIPWTPALKSIPFIVYGARAAVGDTVLGYREGVEATVKAIANSLERAGHSTVPHTLDAAIVPQSAEALWRSVAPGGQIDFVLPNEFDVSPAVKSVTFVGSVHRQPGSENHEELGFVVSRYFTKALQDNSFSGRPF
ncbi:hypothetical protein BBP40_007499 [Aspergillus hancockii]|nr:hypothetical protein BBP40_007499 [Aspergillus hancockii]